MDVLPLLALVMPKFLMDLNKLMHLASG